MCYFILSRTLTSVISIRFYAFFFSSYCYCLFYWGFSSSDLFGFTLFFYLISFLFPLTYFSPGLFRFVWLTPLICSFFLTPSDYCSWLTSYCCCFSICSTIFWLSALSLIVWIAWTISFLWSINYPRLANFVKLISTFYLFFGSKFIWLAAPNIEADILHVMFV